MRQNHSSHLKCFFDVRWQALSNKHKNVEAKRSPTNATALIPPSAQSFFIEIDDEVGYRLFLIRPPIHRFTPLLEIVLLSRSHDWRLQAQVRWYFEGARLVKFRTDVFSCLWLASSLLTCLCLSQSTRNAVARMEIHRDAQQRIGAEKHRGAVVCRCRVGVCASHLHTSYANIQYRSFHICSVYVKSFHKTNICSN